MANLEPPFINISGLPNFRDLGGYAVTSPPGHSVRRGIVYRAAEPSKLTDEGIAALQGLNVTNVYDLRSAVEIERHAAAVRKWPGSQRLLVPVFQDEDFSPEAMALRFNNYTSDSMQGFVEAYKSILEAGAGPFATIMTHLASSSEPPAPILIHCTAGKDRTGVICALILSVCGVDDETIAKEYSLTEVGLAPMKEELLAHLLKSPGLVDHREAAERLLGAP